MKMKNEIVVIIYSPLYYSKPIRLWLIFETEMKPEVSIRPV